MATAPEWYDAALAAETEKGEVDVAGVAIRWEAWGEVGRPGMVLIHGSNAHLEWWRFVAPYLSDRFRVAAFDLSGNGDSGWRSHYSGAVFADETWAVCQAARLGPQPVVVGHSFGGFVALETAFKYGEALRGVIFEDFTVAPPERYLEWGLRAESENKKPRQLRVYPDLETALGRFRLLPEQPTRHPYVFDHIARCSLKQVEGGYTWKFDPTLFDHLEMGRDQRDKFAATRCRSALILGEDSDDEGADFGDYMAEITVGKMPIMTLPRTHHHMMFDEPMALAMTMKALALAWVAEDGREEMVSALSALLEQ